VPPPNYRNSRSIKVGYESYVPITVAALLIKIYTPFESESGRGQKVLWWIVILIKGFVFDTSSIFTPQNMSIPSPPILIYVSEEVIIAPYEEPVNNPPVKFNLPELIFKIFEAVKVPELILITVFDIINRQFADEKGGPVLNPLMIVSYLPEKLIIP
ncbi:MAG: hypothetical protein EZS28_042217, partial [Streblomastix strix]